MTNSYERGSARHIIALNLPTMSECYDGPNIRVTLPTVPTLLDHADRIIAELEHFGFEIKLKGMPP